MFIIKDMVFKCLQVYNDKPDSLGSIQKFFKAYSLVLGYESLINNKPYRVSEISMINKILQMYRATVNDDMKIQIMSIIKKTVDSKNKVVHTFLEDYSDDMSFDDDMFDLDMVYVEGCVGVVKESV